MIVHTIPEAYANDYGVICDWIDARFAETAPVSRHVRFINTRIEDDAFELRSLEGWAADLPMIRPEVLVDLPANYGFLPSFNDNRLHVPFHVVFGDDHADAAAEFEADFLS